jgi:large subunit ribosomal protein L10
MKSKDQKIKELSDMKENFSKSNLVVLTSFGKPGERGLTVSAVSELRDSLREKDAKYVIEKKNLANIVLGSHSKDANIKAQGGTLGMAYGFGDEASTAKALFQFSKSNDALSYFGAIYNGEYLDAERFKELAMLPSREAMLGRLLGMLNYPMTGLVQTLNGVSRNLVVVLNQIASSK